MELVLNVIFVIYTEQEGYFVVWTNIEDSLIIIPKKLIKNYFVKIYTALSNLVS